MRSRVAGGISGLPLSARETVEAETPAMRAMSAICTRRRRPGAADRPSAGTGSRPGNLSQEWRARGDMN